MDARRRTLLKSGALLGLGASGWLSGVPAAGLPSGGAATDANYWDAVANLYDITRDVAMLDNGYWGTMAKPVLTAYQAASARANHDNAWYGRHAFPREFEAARARLAESLGVGVDEIALTRGATEALQALIGGYNRLRPGDAVLHADTDYDGMITAMRWLNARRGVEVLKIDLPEPFTHQNLIDAYARAMERHPRLRLILLTQVSHRHGLRLPVAEIAALARARGIDVIVDAAHGIGQIDETLPRLGADFAGINLHKWIGAPVGLGALYIRRGRVADIDPYMGEPGDAGDIRIRVHTGTVNFAAFATLPAALELHETIGTARKQARLQYLRERWLAAAREMPALQVLASDDPRLASAIASFRLRGKTSLADNIALSRHLLESGGVFTVHRDGLASGACVRVTPAVFTREREIDRLIAALRRLRAH
ncbi:aminotransferase class V-fold PLP-dependent enzyme [Lysobacter pythonis]|uniref:Aminotransferase class V-fold PLP-dependent enzyme n=1 Tax=Solilutibacter pythonis TaxID=2483112 RepID=A0A3M2HSX6_9GAMM|nr:aminotransferase class V-fold PLP-dependent enzyme [Lysobacter pythonis]RMH92851.1 aminotransferase class V-fold PLP-dependent enzyme [Lysobacter pythonis]